MKRIAENLITKHIKLAKRAWFDYLDVNRCQIVTHNLKCVFYECREQHTPVQETVQLVNNNIKMKWQQEQKQNKLKFLK